MNVDSILETIERRYNAEADVPGPYCHPYVSATEYKLMLAIEMLEKRVKELEAMLAPAGEVNR